MSGQYDGDGGRSQRRTPLQFRNRPALLPSGSDETVGLRREPWKVLIADDDHDVHAVSRMLLKDFSFEGRRLNFVSAYSGADACNMIVEHPDTAVLLLDVVMETDHAGLDVVRNIRGPLGNSFVRIILRTGQPGQAPEKTVVEEYDINDYKEKTELTAQKLATAVMAALRSYRDLRHLESSRKGLEQIICAAPTLFEHQSLRRFAIGVLTQLTALLNLGQDALYLKAPASGFAAIRNVDEYEIVAGTGIYEQRLGDTVRQVVPADVLARLLGVAREQCTHVGEREYAGYFRTSTGCENIIYMQACHRFSEIDVRLLQVFSTNLGVAFDNISLSRELADTQTEIIQTLSEVVETRSGDTSLHTLRVGRCARLLGEKLGLSEAEVEILRQTAPMHDLGKVGISDVILNKPGSLTPDEYRQVKTHTILGHNILRRSARPILQVAAMICLQHHERWDGSGYPNGLAGEAIDIRSRIVGLADVFDAISHHRPYKRAWPAEDVRAYIVAQSGRQFDPAIAALMLANFDEFLMLRDEGGGGEQGTV